MPTKREMEKRKKKAAEMRKMDSGSGPVAVQESDVKIGDYPGGRGDRIVLSIRVYSNHKFLDIRRWYLDRKTGAYKPTNKGLSIGANPDVIRSVAKCLTRAAESFELEAANADAADADNGNAE